MSFSNQSDIYYLVNQFHYLLLIRFIKILTVLKRLQFEDRGSNKTELRRSKHQHLDGYDNKKENGLDNEKKNSLDKDENKKKSDRYVLPHFVSLPPFPQKMSNHPSDLGKRI